MCDAGIVRIMCGMRLVTTIVQACNRLKEKMTMGWLLDDGLLASKPHGICCLNTISHVA